MASTDPQNRKPEPCRLLLLSQVHLHAPGSKIRFLGCVDSYQISTGTLVIQAEYAAASSAVPTVLASIDNVLEDVDHEMLQTGAWVNVVGYIRAAHGKEDVPRVEVLMIWSAGAVKVDDYHSAARSYQAAMSID
ncbi:hypothetical protein TI39_contig1051g00016 [Zymoseptoria brevis]|uniref:CST complex subunit Ten1 n=1 Tax=Zymoseptoria brevis TaxID=1047168 RepID=A0A0F4GHV2_9PEZI|nr:hypothetical protein TI39_contig1051g00016 [Zymoseptoria brevis]